MEISFDKKDYEILAFYPYTSIVQDRIADYNEMFKPRGDKRIKDLFNAILDETNDKCGREFNDNKIAFKIKDNRDGKIYYIGQKDWDYPIGESIFQETATEVTFKKDGNHWEPVWSRNEKLNHRW